MSQALSPISRPPSKPPTPATLFDCPLLRRYRTGRGQRAGHGREEALDRGAAGAYSSRDLRKGSVIRISAAPLVRCDSKGY